MRVIAWSSLVAFYRANPKSEKALTHWYSIARSADWRSMGEVQAAFPKAKVLNGERVRFDIAGGNFRLVASFKFRRTGPGIVFVKFIGTHAEYDKVNALTVSRY